MQFYNQSQLFQLLLDAMQRPGYVPDPSLQLAYNKNRLENAIQAIKARNLLLYTEGSRPSTSLNSVFTLYTQPVGKRLMLVGYSENFRYGRISTAITGGPTDKVWPQQHRVRIVGKNPRALLEDLIPSQAGVSGECRYTSPFLPVPEILEPDEQIAVDLGYDSVAGTIPGAIEPQAFVFWCLLIKDKLTADDETVIAEVKRHIANVWYQKAEFLNCTSLGVQSVSFSSAAAGGLASCDTRTTTSPILVTGIGTNLVASKIKITDVASAYSFSLDKFMQSSAFNMPDFSDQVAQDLGAPVSAPLATMYFQLPVPHLLKPGSQFHADIVNGGNAGAGAGSVVDPQFGQVLMFQGISV